MIKDAFLESLSKYITDRDRQKSLWFEIEKNYSKPDRHYHNLTHLNTMLDELEVHRTWFADWDTIIFAIAYHDVTYNTLKTNNEELSADVATKTLRSISFPERLTSFCKHLILATRHHEPSDAETDLFTDADLAILGADPQAYEVYAKQIRREYSIYPDMMYNPGRAKVLRRFLEMPQIYKTKAFADRYEIPARRNLKAELTKLTR